MMRVLFFIVIAVPVFSQTPEKVAMERMEKKGKWPKIEQSLLKSLSKDSINSQARYLFSLYYFSTKNPAYDLDSAYVYAQQAWRNFQSSSAKDRERLKRDEIDSLGLNRLILKIDSAAFESSKRINSENSYQHFIDLHKNANQISSAIDLRDEVAFLNALKFNTWTGFQEFIKKYPVSLRRKDAQSRYDKLLFEDKTGDHKLSSYIKFLQDFPSTPYLIQVEKTILELATIGGSPESFLWFIENYPTGKPATIAKNILYKLQSPDEEDFLDSSQMTDSLRSVEKLNKSYLVPVIKSNKYGFIDEAGNEVIVPMFDMIYEDYRCGEIRDRVLVTSSGLIGRDGHIIWNGKVSETKDIGNGFLLITSDSSDYVIHESGFRIGPKVNSALIIANRFIALGNNKKWSLFSLAGKQILQFSYDEISSIDSVIILTKSGKKILTTPLRISKISGKSLPPSEFVFDDLKRWGSRQYWVRNGLLEGVLDANLNFIIPLERQQLRKTSFGFVHGADNKVQVKGIPRLEKITYRNITEQGGWLRLQVNESRYQLYDKTLDRMTEGDTVWFQGQLAFVEYKDSINAFMPTGQRISFPLNTSFQFLEYRDSSAWLILEEKKKKIIYDAASGTKLFSLDVDQLEPIASDILLVTRAGKKGLITEAGKALLPIEYDAIVRSDSTGFSILKDRKFGWFDSKSKLLIKPLFDRNVKSYSRFLKVAFRGNEYGFIYSDGKPLGTFEWEEIKYWNDSIALVKKNFQWLLFDIYSHKVVLDRIKNYAVVKDSPEEKVFIIRQDNSFGVISSIRGTIIPIQYSDVINLGSKDTPLYFTERNIEEARISVVIYFDHQGKVIRRQAMESEEFERIYCDN